MMMIPYRILPALPEYAYNILRSLDPEGIQLYLAVEDRRLNLCGIRLGRLATGRGYRGMLIFLPDEPSGRAR